MTNDMLDSKCESEFYNRLVLAANRIAKHKPRLNYIIVHPMLALGVAGLFHESLYANSMHQYVECDDFDDEE